MTRIIQTESSGKGRNRLVGDVIYTLDLLFRKPSFNEETQDLASFIALCLFAIAKSIDASASAWEKKGYWIKADKFRTEWEWAARLGETMTKAVMAEDLKKTIDIAIQVRERLKNKKAPRKGLNDKVWQGARKRLEDIYRQREMG